MGGGGRRGGGRDRGSGYIPPYSANDSSTADRGECAGGGAVGTRTSGIIYTTRVAACAVCDGSYAKTATGG